MRAHATVLQIALLVALPGLPGAVDAQQRDTDARPAAEAATGTATPKPAARRSLMGEVMSGLIENAEQSRHRETSLTAKPPVAAGASAPAEPAPADRPQGPQVAAQTPP